MKRTSQLIFSLTALVALSFCGQEHRHGSRDEEHIAYGGETGFSVIRSTEAVEDWHETIPTFADTPDGMRGNEDPEMMDASEPPEGWRPFIDPADADRVVSGTGFSNGRIITSFHPNPYDSVARAVLFFPDGRLMIAGRSFTPTMKSNIALVRYYPDGLIDTTFGSAGAVDLDISGSNQDQMAHAIATDSQGRIIAVGRHHNGSYYSFVTARFLTNGLLDSTGFGTNGLVIESLLGRNAVARDVSIEWNDKIVVAGYTSTTAVDSNYDMAVVRYLTNGTLDTSFSNDGRAFVSVTAGTRNDVAYAVRLDNQSKVALGGYTFTSSYAFAVVRLLTTGVLDTAFSNDGIQTYDFHSTGTDLINGLVIQTDNKIVAGGYAWSGTNYNFAVARFASNGTLDTTFSADGVDTVDITSNRDDFARAVIRQNDNKILLVGRHYNGTNDDFAVVRYLTTGVIDSTGWGTTGRITTSVGTSADFAIAADFNNAGILAAGRTFTAASYYHIAVARYNLNGSLASSGSLDPSFGTDGTRRTDWGLTRNDRGNGVMVQVDGAVVAAGIQANAGAAGQNVAMIRYRTDGSLDTSFTGDGTFTIASNLDQRLLYVNKQWDGKSISVGTMSSNNDWGVIRLLTTGALDTSWSNDGIAILNIANNGDDIAQSVEVQSDGKVVVVGIADAGDSAIARFTTAGALDSTFGTTGTGYSRVDITGLNSDDRFLHMAIQTDGKYVAVGRSQNPTNQDDEFAVARFNTDGRLDTSFGTPGGPRGYVKTNIANSTDQAFAVVVDTNNKIVVSGRWYDATNVNYDVAVVRYLTNGVIDSSFGSNGFASTQITAQDDNAQSMILQYNGKIVVIGEGNNDWEILRYNSDGTLDTSFSNDGIVTTNLGATDENFGIALQQDQKYVVTGRTNVTGDYDFATGRYWP